MRWLRIPPLLGVILTLSRPSAPAWAAESPPPEDLPLAVREFLNRPWHVFRRDRVPRGFRVITVSHLAEACADLADRGRLPAEVALACTDRLVNIATHPQMSPYDDPVSRTPLGHHGLYLTHLNITLGAYARSGGTGRVALHHRIANHLARLSVADPTAHAPSYGGTRVRWPADQAATLYSLHLYDERFGGTLAREPTRLWLEHMDAHGRSDWPGLPVSEVSGRTRTSHLPRGCALSYTVRYMAPFERERAAQLWRSYRAIFAVELGFAMGLREWPPGEERGMDIDSGPILLGVGAAATGLGLGAARAVDDESTYRRLEATKSLIEGFDAEPLRRVGDSILARAIALRADALVRR